MDRMLRAVGVATPALGAGAVLILAIASWRVLFHNSWSIDPVSEIVRSGDWGIRCQIAESQAAAVQPITRVQTEPTLELSPTPGGAISIDSGRETALVRLPGLTVSRGAANWGSLQMGGLPTMKCWGPAYWAVRVRWWVVALAAISASCLLFIQCAGRRRARGRKRCSNRLQKRG